MYHHQNFQVVPLFLKTPGEEIGDLLVPSPCDISWLLRRSGLSYHMNRDSQFKVWEARCAIIWAGLEILSKFRIMCVFRWLMSSLWSVTSSRSHPPAQGECQHSANMNNLADCCWTLFKLGKKLEVEKHFEMFVMLFLLKWLFSFLGTDSFGYVCSIWMTPE